MTCHCSTTCRLKSDTCSTHEQVALVRKEPTLERKAARMAALLRSAQFIGRYTSDLAGREARQQELTKHWCAGWMIAEPYPRMV